MDVKVLAFNCEDAQRPFWARTLAPVVELVCGTAMRHEKMFSGGGLRVLLEIKSGVPKVPRGVLTAQSQAAANQERQLLWFDMASEGSKGTAATAMMQLLQYVPDVMVSGDITGEQLYGAILRKVNGDPGALLSDFVRLGAIRQLKSVKDELSREDGGWIFKKWHFGITQMCKMGAIRVPCARVLLGSKPGGDLMFSDELRISCGGGSPDVNMRMTLEVFQALQESLRNYLRNGMTNAAFTFDTQAVLDASPEVKYWSEKLGIALY